MIVQDGVYLLVGIYINSVILLTKLSYTMYCSQYFNNISLIFNTVVDILSITESYIIMCRVLVLTHSVQCRISAEH